MAVQRIVMTIDSIGVTKIEAEGFQGGTCVDATAPFESLLGKVERERQSAGECGPRKDNGERVIY
jgi:hypothetical protein